MKIMYIILLLILLASIFLAKKGGETLDNSPYVLELVSDIPTGYHVPDTSRVWKVTFISLRVSGGMTTKDLDSLSSAASLCMEQFMFFAELQDVTLSNILHIEAVKEGEYTSFLFSTSKKVGGKKIKEILEQSFFGSPTKKADSCRLFLSILFLRDRQMIHILLRLPE